ncbi:MAG: trypsin-like peptidase domain-containing protein [Bacteroidales bacterium]|nr:trypsin-like peptidase domain-containing protein [Bacteroidales bacterium]
MKTKTWLVGLLSGIIGGGIVLAGTFFFTSNKVVDNSDAQLTYNANKSDDVEVTNVSLGNVRVAGSTDFCDAAEKCMPAVVHIKTSYNQPTYTLYDFIFGTQSAMQVSSSGSGVIVSSDGYVVTNNHVIENAEIIEVVMNNKRSYTGKIIGRDATTDLALLKIDASDLPYLTYGNSDDLRIGEWVLAIGNPFNLTSTVTAGIVSAKARNIDANSGNQVIESYIQTDAAVNPGSSGGALVNAKGELVGINSAIASQTGSYVGYSFAIPVNMVRKIVADLVEFGSVQRAYMGIDMIDLDAQIAKKLNVDEVSGVYVSKLVSGGAAEKAGIRSGDIILGINDTKINSATELLEAVSLYRPGANVTLDVKSGSSTRKVDLTLQNRYGSVELLKSSERMVALGARLEPINDQMKSRLRIRNGLQVNDLSAGKLAASGIQNGFIIVRANNKNINSVQDLENAIKSSGNAIFLEGIYPNGMTGYYALKLD